MNASTARRRALLRDVDRLGQASQLELSLEGHELEAIQACVACGHLKPISIHGPEAYHWELTPEGQAELGGS